MNTAAENVFIVETPLQLLNAIEATRQLSLTGNHLLVHVGKTGFSAANLKLLSRKGEWSGVHYLRFRDRHLEFESTLLGASLSSRVRGYGYDVQQFFNRRTVNALARSFAGVRNIFLGNYLRGHQLYMRHFANKLPEAKVFLLDDGTDVLLIGRSRRVGRDPEQLNSPIGRAKTAFRKLLLDWDERDAEQITFFTAYDVETGPGDRLIKNEYGYLRGMVAESTPSNEVLFLGQCLVEDGYVSERYYLESLMKIKARFADTALVYIPHPRQSAPLVEQIRSKLRIDVRPLDLPIEWAITTTRDSCPRVIGSFFCSALQSCRIILGSRVQIIAFEIDPGEIMKSHDLVLGAYAHFRANADRDFVIEAL